MAAGQKPLSGSQSSLIRRFIAVGDAMEEVVETGGMQSQSFRWNTLIGRLVVRPCARVAVSVAPLQMVKLIIKNPGRAPGEVSNNRPFRPQN